MPERMMKRRRSEEEIRADKKKRRRREDGPKKNRRRSDTADRHRHHITFPNFPHFPAFLHHMCALARPHARTPARTCMHAHAREDFFAQSTPKMAICGDVSRPVSALRRLLVYRVPHAPYRLKTAFLRLYGHYQKLAQNILYN